MSEFSIGHFAIFAAVMFLVFVLIPALLRKGKTRKEQYGQDGMEGKF